MRLLISLQSLYSYTGWLRDGGAPFPFAALELDEMTNVRARSSCRRSSVTCCLMRYILSSKAYTMPSIIDLTLLYALEHLARVVLYARQPPHPHRHPPLHLGFLLRLGLQLLHEEVALDLEDL